MAEIDRKLERLMGQEEYNAILNAPSSITFDTVCHKIESKIWPELSSFLHGPRNS